MKWMALLLFGGIGLVAFVCGIGWGLKRYALLRAGGRATGTVVELNESQSTGKDDDGRTRTTTSYYPRVEFSVAGKTYHFRGSTGSSTPSYEIGAKVPVAYDPQNPFNAQIADFEQFWLGPLGVGLFGFLFLVAGIGSWFLIADSDKTFGPAFHAQIDRARLFEMKQGVPLDASVREVRKTGDGFVAVCRGGAPGGAPREFLSAPLSFDPGTGIVGKKVTVYADPHDAQRYYVLLDPLFKKD